MHAGPKCTKTEVEMARRRRTTVPAQLCASYLLWLYLLLVTVPAQPGCLVVVAEPEVVLYPHDAPRGLLIICSLHMIGALAATTTSRLLSVRIKRITHDFRQIILFVCRVHFLLIVR